MSFTEKLLNSPRLQQFYEAATSRSSLLIEAIWDTPKAALLALLRKATQKNILVLTGERREGRLANDLDYFNLNHVYEFPSWETLPGEEIAPSPDIVGKRFEILYHLLSNNGPHLVLAPLQACLQKLPSIKKLKPNFNYWSVGEEIPFDLLPSFLIALGYRQEAIATDKGQFALRRGILDLFPLSSPDPYRIEFVGDTIESIRSYDPIGQKSIQKVKNLFLCPASEPELLKEEQSLALLLDYLGNDTIVVFDDLLALEDKYVALKGLPGSRSRFFASMDEIFEKIQSLKCHFWTEEPLEELFDLEQQKAAGRSFYSGTQPFKEVAFEMIGTSLKADRWLHPFHTISDFFSSDEATAATSGADILHALSRFSRSALDLHLLTSTQSEEATLKKKLQEENVALPPDAHFERGYLSSGMVISDAQIAILPYTELTGRYRVRRQKWRGTTHTPAAEFHELAPGDLVVHFHSGIGKYLGVEKTKNHLGEESEFMAIEYAQGSKLYVPIASSHLVSRYIGSKEETPTLNQLGTQKWQRMRASAQQAIVGYAEELLRFSAERALKGGFAYPEDSEETLSFGEDFPFVETDDQLKAITAIKEDMISDKAMDRLICGDVGYGKTEVAMRAAFKAVVDGKKQVAVLVPTTVLAMQHFETFSERMANYPITIGVISRFQSAKQIEEALEKAKSGALDILIGTHRIISRDVAFKELGLIIIDEEQRFGVRAKESLKKLKVGVDCLTLSATPIPRTLYLSIIGARDVSIINTPPQDRLPIKSVIAEREPQLIQNALLRELSRDGQAYFIHNRVESIYRIAEELKGLVPEARIVVGHGQMSADELDTVYHAFKNGNADVLIATTIVENGVDIPNANTILIDNSQQFGLADLYQLRGRVGRWKRPAYAYFLVPVKRELAELSQKRLIALIESSGYGGGMKIAMRDLEIRGAGDILGVKQSGQISSIGFHLYCKLLKRTIEALKRKSAPSFIETKIEFSFDARLPEDYIGAASLRMELYHRLGEATALEEAEALLDEMTDRFGPPPFPVIWLYHLTRLRIRASAHNFTLLKFERFTFTVEKMRKDKAERLTFPLPKTKDPALFEQEVARVIV